MVEASLLLLLLFFQTDRMDVVDAQAAWLSNFEVLEHLKAQKALREASKKGRPLQAAENVQTVEFEVPPFPEPLVR